MIIYNEYDEEKMDNSIETNEENNLIETQNVSDKVQEKAKEKVKEKISQKARKSVAKKSALTTALGPILFWIAIIIVIIIIVIGIIMFFITMPGMVMEKLKNIFSEVGSYLAAFFGADTTQQIEDVMIYESLDYLEEMGYDLKGFGFLTGFYEDLNHFTDEEKEKIVEAFKNEKETPDLEERNNIKNYDDIKNKIEVDTNNQGVIRSKNTGNIVLAKSDFVFSYIASDNYVYTLKNDNFVTQENAKNIFEKIAAAIATTVYKGLYYQFSPIFNLFGITDFAGERWGKGLIAVYYEGDVLGDKGTFVNTDTIWNWDNIKINMETQQLIVGRNSLFNQNEPLAFNLDGWSGRYGMPLEFLLSVHEATMMPDLAYNMTKEFPTEMDLYLRKAEGEVRAYYLTRDKKTKVYYDDLNYVLTKCDDKDWWGAIWAWIDNLVQTEKEFRAALEVGVDHALNCTCDKEKLTYYVNVNENDDYGCLYIPDGTGNYMQIKYFIKVSENENHRVYYDMRIDKYYDLDKMIQIQSENNGKITEEERATTILTSEEIKNLIKEVKDTKYTQTKLSETSGMSEITLDNQFVYTRICDACKKHLALIIDWAREPDDPNYEAYIPYIAKVRNHWFRDVHFVINKKELKDFHAIDLDYDYESVMKERWTLYEVDEENNFKLYITDEKGEFAKSQYIDEYKEKLKELEEKALSEDEKEKLRKDHEEILGKIVNDIDAFPDLYYFKDTKDKAVEAGLMVAKKAIELDMQNQETFIDLNWKTTQTKENQYWVAYEEKGDISDYTKDEQVYSEEDIEKEKDENSKDVKSRIYSGISFSKGDIAQVGDGIRSVTNNEIKKMFLYDTYFRYDGNQKTAEDITRIRDFISNEIKLKYKIDNPAYGALNEVVINKKGETEDFSKAIYDEYGNKIELDENDNPKIIFENTNTTHEDDDGKQSIYKVEDYSGQVTINQDSLNAFSMLENTHTLDADYIYRDFKELIVELGYFEKEELTDETPRLLQWIIPDIGSDGYPDRTIDKRENEYGTMIHSKGDIDANLINTLVHEILAQNDENLDEIDKALEEEEENTTREAPKNNPVPQKYYDREHGIKDPLLTTVTVHEFLATARKFCLEMDELGYDYCTGWDQLVKDGKVPTPEVHALTCEYADTCPDRQCPCEYCQTPKCDHQFGHPCTMTSTFEKSKPVPDARNVCCDQFVYWVLEALDLMEEGAPHSINDIAFWGLDLGGTIIDKYEDLKPGDIMISQQKLGMTHIEILGEEETDESFYKYNGGHYASVGNPGVADRSAIGEGPLAFTERVFNSYKFCFGLRLFEDADPYIYEGYRGNEPVVSPVTGLLLEYGTYEPDFETGKHIDTIANQAYRVNVDLKYGPISGKVYTDKESVKTGGEVYVPQIVSDKVGYAKILVLDTENYLKLESNTNNSWNSNIGGTSLVDENNRYVEDLISEKINGKYVTAEEKLKKWNDLDKLVYGYKEFAECYEKYGIAGHVIYIDGFICENPYANTLIKNSQDSLEEIAKMEYSDFKEATTKLHFENEKKEYKGTPIHSKYEPDEEYKLASNKATEKLKAETQVKAMAMSTMYIEAEGIDENNQSIMEELCFIKEGTLLGRTMTDKELIEKRVQDYNENGMKSSSIEPKSYEEVRGITLKKDEKFNQIIGNYIRIIMRDLDGTPIENVEDYMKLDVLTEEERNEHLNR